MTRTRRRDSSRHLMTVLAVCLWVPAGNAAYPDDVGGLFAEAPAGFRTEQRVRFTSDAGATPELIPPPLPTSTADAAPDTAAAAGAAPDTPERRHRVDAAPPASPASQPFPAPIDDLQQEKGERLDRLRLQLERLSELLDRPLRCEDPVPTEDATDPQSDPAVEHTDSPASSPDEGEDTPLAEGPAGAESDAPNLAGDSPRSADPSDPLLTELPLHDDAIVDQPVDRLALADSLFAAGETPLALNAYLQVDTSGLTADERLWLTYQIACCRRRLGELSEAERAYRELAGRDEAGWYAELARWWLDAIQTSRSHQERLTRIQQTYTILEQQRHEQSSQ